MGEEAVEAGREVRKVKGETGSKTSDEKRLGEARS